VGFDEVTQFILQQYLFLFSRTRSTIPNLWPRIRSTTNPVGIGIGWCRKRFIKSLKSGVAGWFLPTDDPEIDPCGQKVAPGTKDALDRVFIPGTLSENLILSQDVNYRSRIMVLGKRMARALLFGDWDAFSGEFFSFNPSEVFCKPFKVPKDWTLILSIDPGYSKPCSAGLLTQSPQGKIFRVSTYYEMMKNPPTHAKAIKKFIEKNKWTGGKWPDVLVIDPSAFAKRDKYAMVESDRTFAGELELEDIICQPAYNDRVPGWMAWRSLLDDKKFFIFQTSENAPLVDEMIAAVPDERKPEDVLGLGNDPSVSDHALDENRYAIMACDLPEVEVSKHSDDDAWVKGYLVDMEKTLRRQGRGIGGWRPGMR
jgi:hypothetical protein